MLAAALFMFVLFVLLDAGTRNNHPYSIVIVAKIIHVYSKPPFTMLESLRLLVMSIRSSPYGGGMGILIISTIYTAAGSMI